MGAHPLCPDFLGVLMASSRQGADQAAGPSPVAGGNGAKVCLVMKTAACAQQEGDSVSNQTSGLRMSPLGVG